MELSILIPTYNYDCQPLVDELNRQAEALNLEYEIIVLNDASTMDLHFSGCRQIDLETNAGRARGRNTLAENAKYSYLLFIDSDSMPAGSDYLRRWTELATEGCVIMGGRVYNEPTDREHSLLPKYGKRERNRREGVTHASFTSPNFLIDKQVFNKVKFNEEIVKYGHEDTIFGIELHRLGIEYSATDNPVIHCHIESNEDFLDKTTTSLLMLFAYYKEYPELHQLSKVDRLSRLFCFNIFGCFLRDMRLYLSKHGNVALFQFYKLVYYSVTKYGTFIKE